MTDCLDTPVILREVLLHFSTTQLLQLSLVNKEWNYEARSIMRTRGDLSASLNPYQECQALRAFASGLQRMKETTKVLPVTGMTIALGGRKWKNKDYCQQSLPNQELDPVYEEILDGLTWKHLSVRILVGWKDHKNCPGFLLVKKILQNFASVLEEFKVEIEWDAAKYFTAEFLHAYNFSRLMTFRLWTHPKTEATVLEYTGLIKTVVSRAPNLQAFYSNGEVDLHGNLMEGSSAVHVAGFPYSICDIPENIPSELRLERFYFNDTLPDSSVETFNRMTSTLLQTSRAVMNTMWVDVAFLVPLMAYGICLENVRKFEISVDLINLQNRQLDTWRLVKHFDFTRLFPRLDRMRIIHDFSLDVSIPEDFSEMIPHKKAVIKASSPDRAINIKYLKLQRLPARVLRERSSFQLLAHMFPNVQKLSIKTRTLPLSYIGSVWLDLDEIHIKLDCSKRRPINLDSVLCGIFPQEVAQLKEQDEEYLRSVNIVPVMPSIYYLKELRTLTVSFDGHDDDDDDDDDSDSESYLEPTDEPTSCTFSKVAGLIARQRCRNLTITLTTTDEGLGRALSHLRPYASVVLERKTCG